MQKCVRVQGHRPTLLVTLVILSTTLVPEKWSGQGLANHGGVRGGPRETGRVKRPGGACKPLDSRLACQFARRKADGC